MAWLHTWLDQAHGPFTYLAILIAAALEGEIVFTSAAMLVSQGKLDALPTALAGAGGAALGDQVYFYLLRGRVDRWLHRIPTLADRGAKLAGRVRRAETITVLMLRFSPGLRIALAAACAYARVPALKFSLLNALTCLLWAGGLLAIVAWFGPAVLGRLGISGWWAALIPAALIVVIFTWIGRTDRR